MVDVGEGKRGTKRLVVFDVEGIVIPKNRYLLFEISRKMGLFGFVRIAVLGFLYSVGLLSLEVAMKKIFVKLRGLDVGEVFGIHGQIPLMPGVEEVFARLKSGGYRMALISSGLPTVFVEDLAARLGADYAYGLELEVVDGRLTGKIGGDVLVSGGKAVVLLGILEKEGLTAEDCVVVADDRNNVSMFPLCGLRIGYNPDFVLTARSDFVTRGALTEVLPPITGEKPQVPRAFISRSRGLREAIHVSSFLLSFVGIYVTGNVLLAVVIVLLAVVYGFSEWARVRGVNVPVISAVTWNAANKTELYEFATAPIYFALGIAVSLLVFPVPVCYVAVTVLTLGDGCAHILGRKFRRTSLPYNRGKSVEGTVFGFLFAFLGARLFVGPVGALVGAGVGMLVEGLPSPVNDNLSIPLVVGLAVLLVS